MYGQLVHIQKLVQKRSPNAYRTYIYLKKGRQVKSAIEKANETFNREQLGLNPIP